MKRSLSLLAAVTAVALAPASRPGAVPGGASYAAGGPTAKG